MFIKRLSIFLVFVLPIYLFAWKMESGKVSLPATTVGSSSWEGVSLQQSYDVTPLIFVLVDQGSGYDGDSPVALRIRNITTTGFEVVQVEPQSSTGDVEGEHAGVDVHYIAIEAGDHTLSNGMRILAATKDTDSYQGKYTPGRSWESISFSSSFSDTPVVLSMIQSLNNESSTLPGASSSPWMTVAMRDVDSSGFDMALDRAETSTGSITTDERVAYLVVDADVQGVLYDPSCIQFAYETILTSDSVRGWDNGCYDFSFANTYTVSPNVVGNQETRDGGDGGWLRRCSLSSSAVGITVDEDQASDSERSHTTEIAGLFIFENDFIFDSLQQAICLRPEVNFRMDECYWLGGANGVTDDVKDSSGNGLDAQSRNKANNISSIYKICRGGDFVNTYSDQSKSDAVYYPNSTAAEVDIGENEPFSVSAWVYRHGDRKWMAAVIKVSDDGWTDGWGLEHAQNSGSNIYFFVGNYNTYARASLSNDTWTHIVGTYDGSTIEIYKNGVLADTQAQSSYSPGALAVSIGDDISGSSIDDRWQGNLDEVKIWHRALSASEISTIYNNENSGLNYDGTTRVCKSCNGSSISANTWDLVGVPADSRTTPLSVDDIFGDDMNGTIGTDWVVYKRTYSSTDNSSGYLSLGLSDSLEFGQGYWLGSKLNSEWYVDGVPTVDYDSTSSACTASACVEIDLTSVTHDFAVDGNDGTGPYRYNMSGFIGVRVPVNWADCRFLIDGTAYTPSQADADGYASKQIWLYNGTGTDRSNSYITCDDTTPGECKLVPFKGFWVELHGPTKNRTVKLLIPQE